MGELSTTMKKTLGTNFLVLSELDFDAIILVHGERESTIFQYRNVRVRWRARKIQCFADRYPLFHSDRVKRGV